MFWKLIQKSVAIHIPIFGVKWASDNMGDTSITGDQTLFLKTKNSVWTSFIEHSCLFNFSSKMV